MKNSLIQIADAIDKRVAVYQTSHAKTQKTDAMIEFGTDLSKIIRDVADGVTETELSATDKKSTESIVVNMVNSMLGKK